jgi:hypothetical protein
MLLKCVLLSAEKAKCDVKKHELAIAKKGFWITPFLRLYMGDYGNSLKIVKPIDYNALTII